MTKLAEQRLERTCEGLLTFTTTLPIRTLNTILKSGQDKLSTAKAADLQREPEKHGITCRAAYFRKGDASKW